MALVEFEAEITTKLVVTVAVQSISVHHQMPSYRITETLNQERQLIFYVLYANIHCG